MNNKEYAKYIDEKTIIEGVPRELDYEGVHYIGDLTQYPAVLSAFDFFPVEYALSSYTIIRSYIVVEDQPVYRNLSLSKRKLMNNLKTLGVWTQVKAYLEATGAWDDFDMATTLDEQEDLMQSAIVALKAQLGLSDETVDELLINSVAE